MAILLYPLHQLNQFPHTSYLQLLLPLQTSIPKPGLVWIHLRTSSKCLFWRKIKAIEPFITCFTRLCQKPNTKFWKFWECKISFFGRNIKGKTMLMPFFTILGKYLRVWFRLQNINLSLIRIHKIQTSWRKAASSVEYLKNTEKHLVLKLPL